MRLLDGSPSGTNPKVPLHPPNPIFKNYPFCSIVDSSQIKHASPVSDMLIIPTLHEQSVIECVRVHRRIIVGPPFVQPRYGKHIRKSYIPCTDKSLPCIEI